jgi:hypothetical protein
MKHLGRFKCRDYGVAHCRIADDVPRGSFTRDELGKPVATYPSGQYVVSIDPKTGDIEIFGRPEFHQQTTDRRNAPATLSQYAAKLRDFWGRKS